MRICDAGDFVKVLGVDGKMKRAIITHPICRGHLMTVEPSADRPEGEYRRCIVHGVVKLMPFYEMKQNGITMEKFLYLYWGCLQCLEAELGTFKEAEAECCTFCTEMNNLVDCLGCAAPVCKKHSINEFCEECINEGRKGGGH